jgi:hypothetical protein
MSPLHRSVLNMVLIAQKRRSRALPTTGTEVDSFPVYGEHNLLVLSALSKLSGGLRLSCLRTVFGRLFGTRALAIRLIN